MKAFLTQVLLITLILSFALGTYSGADIVTRTENNEYIVRRDNGGGLLDRLVLMRDLAKAETEIKIAGSCASACTMFLSMACVEPNAKLGFHGPSMNGKPLDPFWFDYWSMAMAKHYPPKIKELFLSEWRHTIITSTWISGAEAIRLGATEC